MRQAIALAGLIAAIDLANPAQAGTRQDILDRAAQCSASLDDRTWLNCYYGAAQPMRAQLGLPPAPQSQTALVPSGINPASASSRPMASTAPVRSHKSGGGFFSSLLGGDAVLSGVPATAYSFDSHGIFKIALSDGSIWQQLEDDDSFAQWRAPASHYLVSITTGSMGSFNLEVQGDNRSYKVRRLN